MKREAQPVDKVSQKRDRRQALLLPGNRPPTTLPGWGARFGQEGVELTGTPVDFNLPFPPAGVGPPIPSALSNVKKEIGFSSN